MLRKTILLAVLCVVLTTPAFAVSVKIESLANQTSVRGDSTNASFSAQTGIGGGAELSIPFSSNMSFDIGALYIQRKYKDDITGGLLKGFSAVQTQGAVEIPVLLRWWLGSVFSVGVGGYYVSYMGNIKNTTTTPAGVSTDTMLTYADAGQTKSDVGLSLAVGLDIPMGMMTGLVIDGRYNYGLKNQSTTGTAKFSDMQGIIGLRFGMNMMK
ncbi:MAG: PorT family protein [Deltaproteobacteria bacterium]|nr:PorT family protein [Deltaproteobacteria bacterium]